MSELLENVKRALVNRYLIEREVGSGGMAVVYLAEDVKHRRKVAIKALKPELAASIGADRFLREIEIAAGLNHPHILPLYDSGEAGGLLFYVMPYVEGESLRDRLRRERQLPLEDALQIAREVADGLSYAHSLGIIHRDIKPENVLLSGGHAVIADFGIARAIAAAGGEHLTETGMSLGTPTYMSPEQAAGAGRLDGRSDLYSLGCMVYEMLAGQPPFGGPTVESILHQHLTLDAPSVGAVRPSVPVQVATAVQRAMAKTPADRFATASEFGGELGFAAARVRLSGSVPMEGLAEPAATAGIRDARLRRLLGYAAIGTVAVGVGIAVASLIQGRGGADGKRLTVLPFENLGLADDEYFAAGITDEITSRLAGVGGLSVMARQSALQYKGTNKTPQQIGSELNVDYLLTGTISWQKGDTGPSRVRVRPQLIQAADASQLWADVYDEDMTEVFTVQANIAEQVVSALGLALVEPEREAIDARPTENLEAYDFYLQGNDFLDRPAGAENYGAAERMYERALELDTSFALAAAMYGSKTSQTA
ncbi:MAG: protein kinase, partial [Gemmatimonadales bacterium]